MAIRFHDQNKDCTLFLCDISEHVTEEILTELFMQVGPVVFVNIPRDRITNRMNGYAFVEFRTEQDCMYALSVMQGVKLFGVPLKLSANSTPSTGDELDVGAKLYIGNLSQDVNDGNLLQTFRQFGNVLHARVVVDPATGKSLGHGFVAYDSFDAADKAKKAMNGEYFGGQPITVSYAYKSGTKSGEKHGDRSERSVAPNAQIATQLKKIKRAVNAIPDVGV
ncbi:spliceosomal protein, putative [Trichomonas vaginalis G3]|uniref:Spliceosomal protein, putative n=1 Tax=Trichomonas vaginalis (strain ATCC PRA-98 / G3) TaxID=412133 RepID=A2E4P7_TRIV3|nr:RNA splicing [Trichomonas vaginalis G3]EAY12357.1 spliceosomal protein, putative [Trichomonas vaginalis G3]KAI5500775.1 RNA splicing [Trichomonas vaginalis G3]|eukprot:XP_001324580.1 spliceosomal protein [Trichomonas vaginalis G3]